MAWITPPSFADGSDLLASDLNTIAGDLAYLKAALEAVAPAVEFKTGTSSFVTSLGGVYFVAASVTFAAGADLNHRISLNIGGERTQKSLGGGVTTQLCVAGIARLDWSYTVSVTSTGQGDVNSSRIAGVRIGA